jgi:hypothetical protein
MYGEKYNLLSTSHQSHHCRNSAYYYCARVLPASRSQSLSNNQAYMQQIYSEAKAGQTTDQARDQQAGPRTQSGRVAATLTVGVALASCSIVRLQSVVNRPILGAFGTDNFRLSVASAASIISLRNSTKVIWTSTSPDEGSNDGRHWCERRCLL